MPSAVAARNRIPSSTLVVPQIIAISVHTKARAPIAALAFAAMRS